MNLQERRETECTLVGRSPSKFKHPLAVRRASWCWPLSYSEGGGNIVKCMFSSKFYRIPFFLPCNPRHAQTREHAERAEAAAAKQVESARAVAELKVESARALEAAKVELAGEIGGQKVKLARAEEALRVRCADCWVGSRRVRGGY